MIAVSIETPMEKLNQMKIGISHGMRVSLTSLGGLVLEICTCETKNASVHNSSRRIWPKLCACCCELQLLLLLCHAQRCFGFTIFAYNIHSCHVIRPFDACSTLDNMPTCSIWPRRAGRLLRVYGLSFFLLSPLYAALTSCATRGDTSVAKIWGGNYCCRDETNYIHFLIDHSFALSFFSCLFFR